MESSDDNEVTLDKYISDGKTEEALDLLYAMIEEEIKTDNIKKAELLRDRMYDVDIAALNIIIKVNTLIENAQSLKLAGSKQNREDGVLSEFYNLLTDEECDFFVKGLEGRTYEPNTTLVKQGEMNPYLFFVNDGTLTITYRSKDKDIFIKKLQQGFSFGIDTFFNPTVSTTSLSTVLFSRVLVLHKDLLKKWATDSPFLADKLFKYCSEKETVADLLKKAKRDRRSNPRLTVTGKLEFKILKMSGGFIEKGYTGNLINISQKGLAFYIKTKEEKMDLLLGRKLKIFFKVSTAKGVYNAEYLGTVVAIHLNQKKIDHWNKFPIHIKCEQHMSQIINLILRTNAKFV